MDQLVYAVTAFVWFDGRLSFTSLGVGMGSPVIALSACMLFFVLHAYSYFEIRWSELLDRAPAWAVTGAYFVLGIAFFFGWPTSNAPFIYFQF